MPPIVPSVLFLALCAGVLRSDKPVPCNQPLFQTRLQLCLSRFNGSMEQTEYRSYCVWPQVKGFYFELQRCVAAWAKPTACKGVGSLTDDFFLEVHHAYFQDCGRVQDPPLTTLVLMVAPLTVTTLLLPTLCVYLTTKDGYLKRQN